MSNNLKINICYDFQDGPWGGGNQFFKILRQELRALGAYAETPEEAEVILFYSYQKLREVIALKEQYPNKFFIHRLGTVLSLHRGQMWKTMDTATIMTANKLADGVVLISHWLEETLKELGLKNHKRQIIHNAVDGAIFNNENKVQRTGKVKLIATSWSTNANKGFDFYQYLEQQLDWEKYEMTFVGNAPRRFKKIKMAGPLTSEALAKELKKHDIYITATRDDALSNGILEALATGLPVLAIASGGNAEAVGEGGKLFKNQTDVLSGLEELTENYDEYRQKIKLENSREIAQAYCQLAKSLAEKKPRKINCWESWAIKATLNIFKSKEAMKNIIEKMKSYKRASYHYYKYTWHRNLLESRLLATAGRLTGKILDVGSKNRRYDQLFSGEITAVDIEPNEQHGVSYGDVQNLPFEEKSFDGVLCLETLCYVKKIEQAIKEIQRVLKDGGQAIVSIPFMQHDHGDNLRLSKKFAEELFREAGFTQVNVEAYGNGHIAVWDIVRKKLTLNQPYWQRKLAYYLILLPWLSILKIFKLDKVQDKYYTGLFITLKK